MRKRSASEEEQEQERQAKFQRGPAEGLGSSLSAAAQPFVPTGEPSPSRPVKAMPAKSKTLKGSNSYLPVQAKVPKTAEEKENTKRLIVILSKVRTSVQKVSPHLLRLWASVRHVWKFTDHLRVEPSRTDQVESPGTHS